MIIIKLIGGLGNQMFQYAAARRLAEKHSTILKLDVTGFEEYKLHRYSLHCFQIREYLATQTEIENIRLSSRNILKKMKQRIGTRLGFESPREHRVIIEKQFYFDPEILKAPDNAFLEGYWQSEKYFFDISDILRHEFVIKYQQDMQSKSFADLIQNSESVSLHIRRADYVQDACTNKIHGTCDQGYYDRSIRYIWEHVLNPHFFIFSDEPKWVKDNLRLDCAMTIIDCNDARRNYEDLRLMSLCKHNIIANSSFSWWGGWLNSNPNKLVIAPLKWFNDEIINTKDLIPEQWIKM